MPFAHGPVGLYVLRLPWGADCGGGLPAWRPCDQWDEQPCPGWGLHQRWVPGGRGPRDFGSEDPLAGAAFQALWEEKAYAFGRPGYEAPAQRVGDFLRGLPSPDHLQHRSTYRPGVCFGDLRDTLPPLVTDTLAQALPVLDRKLHGFAAPDALMVGVETRSSSPVRLLRDKGFQSNLRGLYPCGEGAGYAGGIVSAAVDGLRVAEAVAHPPET